MVLSLWNQIRNRKLLSHSLPWLNICEQCSPINAWYLPNRCLLSCFLLGWEPFIEPWPCSVSWQQQATSRLHPPRLKLQAKAKTRLDVNITSVLIGEWKVAFRRWYISVHTSLVWKTVNPLLASAWSHSRHHLRIMAGFLKNPNIASWFFASHCSRVAIPC